MAEVILRHGYLLYPFESVQIIDQRFWNGRGLIRLVDDFQTMTAPRVLCAHSMDSNSKFLPSSVPIDKQDMNVVGPWALQDLELERGESR